MKRRSLLLAGLGPAAALADEQALWKASYKTPAGAELKLAALRGRWLLVNFWATWCAPCVKELPDLDRFWRDSKALDWEVVGLAIDGPTPVREFLSRRPVGFAIGLAGLTGSVLMRDLGNRTGGLPFTVIARPDGGIAWRRPGETNYAMLVEQRRKLAGR